MKQGKVKVSLDKENKIVIIEDDSSGQVLQMPFEQANTVAVEVIRLIGVDRAGGRQIKNMLITFVHPEEKNESKSSILKSPIRGFSKKPVD